MDLHLAGRILAVIWIAVSLWIGGLSAFILFLLLTGLGEWEGRPWSIREGLGIVLFFLISGTAVATWTFDSPAAIPRNLAYVLFALAPYALASIAIRVFSRHQRP